MIELKSADRRHDSGVLALEGLNLRIAPGEVLGVMGPSGCGKSSLLRLLAGIDRVSAGELLRDGEPVRSAMPDASFVFSSAALMPWASVVTNVELPLRQQGHTDAAARERQARAALAAVGLADAADRMPRELDEGARMLAALARALVTGPALLLLDNWLGAQTEAVRTELQSVLAQRCKIDTDRAVVLTTHSVEEAVWQCQRVIVLSGRPGHIVEDLRIEAPAVRDAAFASSPAFAAACERLRQALNDSATALAA